ncbi:cytochrome P450 [Schizophyllum amplum]|uniref:Cytochrome P450 n=1 Tax=Schizophyllum amplum TaxID=97359 RepID=A0A550C2D7_9AGAR|nr:cytochrome P450 [Auriculariopsis ampla]
MSRDCYPAVLAQLSTLRVLSPLSLPPDDDGDALLSRIKCDRRSSFASLMALFGAAVYFYARRRRSIPLPPGPRKLPLIGNMLDMPTSFEWESYTKWAKALDTDILHLDVAGQSIIVLDTYDAAVELMEKRSKVYSSRPSLAMADLSGQDFNVGLKPYGEEWRARRRLIHEAMRPTAATFFRPSELRATHAFLRTMLEAGENDLETELQCMAGMVILRAAYGVDIKANDDPHIREARTAVRIATSVATPAFLVNSIPALKYLPMWMPGAGFKRQAREWSDLSQEAVNRPFYDVKRRMAANSSLTPSFTSIALAKGVNDSVIRDAAATMYLAGADTTVVTVLNFTIAVLNNPAIQERAQEELDAVLAPGQLPDFTHEDRLPFVTAVVRETLRWVPVAPMGVPHFYSGTEPDDYEGYAIPRDSVVFANIWSMVHDETVYPESYTFKPERFLTAEGKLDPVVRDPSKIVFGFGRRVCPGRHLGYASTWITIASILRVFNIERANDAYESITGSRHHYRQEGIILSPKHFKCVFRPRAEEAVTMIRNTTQ